MGGTTIWAPVLYVTLLIGSLLTFSRIYRKRAASRQQFEPWYPNHPERDLYVSLLQSTDPPAPENLLKAALLRRAAADVGRILRIREDKQALQLLLQKGSVGDDLWNSCLAAEKELEAEILEVIGEANSFRQGWGQLIFASASEILQHDKIKETLSGMPKLRSEAEAKYPFKKPNVPTTPPASATTTGSSIPVPSDSPRQSALAHPSMHLSDGESVDSLAGSPNTSRKSSGKKGKKRK